MLEDCLVKLFVIVLIIGWCLTSYIRRSVKKEMLLMQEDIDRQVRRIDKLYEMLADIFNKK